MRYASCMDALTGIDFAAMFARLDNKNRISVRLLLRGPLAKRTHKPQKTLERILHDLPESKGVIRQKRKQLPPLLPDFNHVSAILQEWNLHNFMVTVGGCSGCMAELPDYPRYRLHKCRLDDVLVALGCDLLLENGIAADAVSEKKKMTALICGAALTMAGFDYDGLAHGLRRRGVNCVVLPSNGFNPGPVGAAEAFLRLGQAMLENSPKRPDQVNMIGYDPMVFLSQSKIAHGIEHLERRSLSCCILGSGDDDDVRNASGAALNWVVSAEGLALAKYMERQFGIPYICGIPIGKYAMMHWRKKVNEMTQRDDEIIDLPKSAAARTEQPEIVLIGEPMLTQSLASCLRNDLGLCRTKRFVYDPRGSLRQLYEKDFPEASFFSDEEELCRIVKSADVWIADPLYRESVPEAEAVFVPVPEPLISGMRFADLPYDIFGKKGGLYLETSLKQILQR